MSRSKNKLINKMKNTTITGLKNIEIKIQNSLAKKHKN
jgi:hypothetical protein